MKSQTRRHKLFELLLLIMFGVLMYISQVIMSSLPNIEIVSLLIILTTRKFGLKAFYAVYTFVGCEILTYGLSEWAVNYLYVWAVLCLSIFFIRKIDSAAVYSLVAAIYGLLFGTLCSIPSFLIGGVSLGLAYIISGFWYDILHCIGNLILTAVLYRPLTKALDRALKTA